MLSCLHIAGALYRRFVLKSDTVAQCFAGRLTKGPGSQVAMRLRSSH